MLSARRAGDAGGRFADNDSRSDAGDAVTGYDALPACVPRPPQSTPLIGPTKSRVISREGEPPLQRRDASRWPMAVFARTADICPHFGEG